MAIAAIRVTPGHCVKEGGAAQSQSGEAKPSKARIQPLSYEATSGGAKCRVHHETWVLHPELPPHGTETDLENSHPLLLTHLYNAGRGKHFGNSQCTSVLLPFLLKLWFSTFLRTS